MNSEIFKIPIHPLIRVLIYNVVIAFIGSVFLTNFEDWGMFILLNTTFIIATDLLVVLLTKFLANKLEKRLSILEPWASIFYYVVTVILVIVFLI